MPNSDQAAKAIPSAKAPTSPSTVVTLSKDADKGQSPDSALTYHRVYRSQPFNTPNPDSVKYDVVPDASGSKSTSAEKPSEGASASTDVAKTSSTEKSAKADKTEAPGKLQALAYGALGIDQEEAKEKESDYYNAGQVLKVVGTVGGLIALFV
ncbi:hypothetical protein [Celerinatantimonas sp. YJH-8]|uniref:hypothetical protein n=1 Tax=Celerinatantimonas sp. YJH-8 TaxID=3228714 RepID=UPI0038C78BC7